MMEAEKTSALNELISLFEYNISQYKGKTYDEAKTRADFIDKFFSLLGWDIYNTQGHSEQYREVVREDKVTIKGKVKAPDYCFRIGSERKFFVEAKKPSIDIKHDIVPAFQLRRYAYTSKLPLSILTDFEEFAVYDTRIKPDKSDKASTGRIFYCTYKDYPAEIDFITGTFSKQAILKGSFDKYIQDNKRKKGTSEVDKEFLKLIEKWREDLAKNIALRNKHLSIYELNYVVQAIIDRIIFLRIAEDRHMEPYGRIQNLPDMKKPIYPELVKLFLQADVKYNSGLFDFRKDEISPHLSIVDRVFKDIIKNLYYPDSPYEFSVLDVEILGNIYEQFLGKTIRLTPAHQAKVEDKPEVKKAGGVYYTPKYIVDYIVRHTVGEKIKGKKPGEISKLKILDPACGSGSFLLGAYQLLLDHHLNYYTGDHADKKLSSSNKQQVLLKKALKENRIYQVREGEFRLTIEEKHNILLNNIFGVDIDRQAVEVTKLSLLLKLLEGESMESAGLLFKYSDIKLLPDLSDNIKCGNSLIGSDFYNKGQMSLFQDEETVRRINVFDWEEAFPEIFQQGGFDVVIGNPPYGAIFSSEEVKYLMKKFPQTQKFPDSYCFFMIKALQLSREEGIFSFIVPNTFCDLESCHNFRNWLLREYCLLTIWQTGWAFKSAIVDTLVFIISKRKPPGNSKVSIIVSEKKYSRAINQFITNELCKIDYRNTEEDKKLLEKIAKSALRLGEITIVKAGVKMYEKGKGTPPQTKDIIKERPFSIKGSCPTGWKKLIRGTDILRYFLSDSKEFVNYGPWLAASRSPDLFLSPKILMRRTDDHLKAILDQDSAICVNSCHIIKYKEPYRNSGISYSYLLGLLNSRLIQRIFELQNPQMIGKIFAEIKVIYVERLPIKVPNFSVQNEKLIHDRMVEMVEHMLELQKKYHGAKIETEKNLFKKQIHILDQQIDQLVYQLYQLTDQEIKIIENDVRENK